MCGGWPGYVLWGTYLGLGRDEAISPLGKGLCGVWSGIARCPCLWKDRPWKKKWKCVYYSTSVYYIYIYICIMTISYINNMSKFIFVTRIYDASICLLILSIHTFVCLLFCLSKAIGFPKLVNSSQVKPVDMCFFKKHANEQFHELYNPVNDPLCKHPDFSYGPSPVSGDFIAGQNLYAYEKFLVAGCLRPLERFIPFDTSPI